MRHLRFSSLFSCLLSCTFAFSLLISIFFTGAGAAPGDAVIIRIFVASYWSATDYHVEPAGSDTIIPPVEISEQGEAFALYSFALVEGTAYDFVYLPENAPVLGENPVPVPLRFTASAYAPEHICEVISQTLQARPASSPTASPGSSSTARPSATAGPSEKLTIDASDANAIVLADTGAPAPEGNPGDAVLITLPLAVNREYFPMESYALRNITIEPDIPERRRGDADSISDWPFDIEKASYLRTLNDMGHNARMDVSFEFRISPEAEAGAYPVRFTLSATVWRYDIANGTTITEDVEFTLTQYVNVLGSGGAPSALTLSATWKGGSLLAPRGKGGERITVRLPLVSNGDLTGITIEPVFSADADECPIVFEAVNYTQALDNLAQGESTLVEFNFKLLPDENGGNKPLTFKAKYRNGGVTSECLLTTFLYVEPEAASEASENVSPDPPVLTLEGYALAVGGQASESLYAGDTARLALQLRNNAATSSAYRLRVAITPGDMLLLEPGTSNTQYIESIAANESASVFFDISARDNAMQGPASIDISLEYEGEDGESASFSQSISISLLQRVRVETEPAIVNGGNVVTAGEPFPVRVKLLNLGMAEIRNVRAQAEGDGLTTFESYFSRALLSSESVNVELLVLSEEGEHSGHIVITCESGNGETHELSEPIRVTAEAAEAIVETPLAEIELHTETNDALMTAVIAGASALAIALGALAYLFYKRRFRKKSNRTTHLSYRK